MDNYSPAQEASNEGTRRVEAETTQTRSGLKNCLYGRHGGLAKAPLLLFPVPHDDSGHLGWGKSDVSFAKGPQHRSLTPNRQCGQPQDSGAILLVLLPEAIWALLETPCLAQLPAQLLLVGLLHGFDGWKQGRGVEGLTEQLHLLHASTCTTETAAQSGMPGPGRIEWLWVSCWASLRLSSKGRQQSV